MEAAATTPAGDLDRALREVFGFGELRPGQRETLDDVMAGRPVIAVMPTGAGKSLCYQLPAVVLGERGGVTLVVSPLIALMKDQVDGLRARGVATAALTSASSPEEQREILEGVRAGVYSLVYVAPERFRSGRFLDALAALGDRLALLAVDEAHCISEWGHEFRPDYRRLGEAVKALAPPRLIALTATATPEVRRDIATQLGLEAPSFRVRGFDRPNLCFRVEPSGGPRDKEARLVEHVRRRGRGTAVVYAATRKSAERYAEALAAAGMRAQAYHAGQPDEARKSTQEAFMDGGLDAIVATNAFGMGVDKADVAVVVHADLPRSAEAYYQEAGRAGRDGHRADCVLLFNPADARLQEFLIDSSYPSAELLRAVWKQVRDDGGASADPERLRRALGDEPSAAAIRSSLRILLRHGFLRDDGDWLAATRPDPEAGFPPLDPQALARRADIERGKLRAMVEYGYHAGCRRRFILDYFGDADAEAVTRGCERCDNCLGAGHAGELSEEQKVEVVALCAVVSALGGRLGRTRAAAVAAGSPDEERFADLPEYGSLPGRKPRQLVQTLRALEGAGLIEVVHGDYPTIRTTERGDAIASGREDPGSLRLLIHAPRPAKRRAKAVDEPRGPLSDPRSREAARRLRELRGQLAAEQSVPAYVVFSNKTLDAIARALPETKADLAALPGIGQSRLDAYGDAILETIAATA
jgi:ATP-dependent DNA helicase RecQ